MGWVVLQVCLWLSVVLLVATWWVEGHPKQCGVQTMRLTS